MEARNLMVGNLVGVYGDLYADEIALIQAGAVQLSHKSTINDEREIFGINISPEILKSFGIIVGNNFYVIQNSCKLEFKIIFKPNNCILKYQKNSFPFVTSIYFVHELQNALFWFFGKHIEYPSFIIKNNNTNFLIAI